MNGRLGEQEDQVKDVVNNEPGHVFSITQVLTLQTHDSQHQRVINYLFHQLKAVARKNDTELTCVECYAN